MEERAERPRSVKIHTDRRDLTRLKSAHLKSGHLFFFSDMYLSTVLISVNMQLFALTSLLPSFLLLVGFLF